MTDEPLQFTDAAIKHIKKTMRDEGGLFHLAVKKAGCSGYMYRPEMIAEPQDSDQAIVIDDECTVYVDQASIPLMQGTTVDYVLKGLGQQQMVFLNPNAASECGCGESFFLDEDENGDE